MIKFARAYQDVKKTKDIAESEKKSRKGHQNQENQKSCHYYDKPYRTVAAVNLTTNVSGRAMFVEVSTDIFACSVDPVEEPPHRVQKDDPDDRCPVVAVTFSLTAISRILGLKARPEE